MAALNQNSAASLLFFLGRWRESIKNVGEAACGCSASDAVIVGTFTSSQLRQNACVAIKSSPHLTAPTRVKIINKY
jgi:hypothetical protein